MPHERIDKLLTDLGLASSRTKAQAMVMSGVVLVDEKRVEKASEKFAADAQIRIKGDSPENKYVSRGGLKIEAALETFGIDPSGLHCIDVGSSTGGFTDCLLEHGAARVTCIDSGTNQLDWRLRTDERVEVRENTNARALTAADFASKFDLAVVDVSFISVTKILPALIDLLTPHGQIVVLIKPQFEVGRGEVGKGGIVREAEKHDRVVNAVNAFAEKLGLAVCGVIDSPILGAEGNKEFLAKLPDEDPSETKRFVEGIDFYFDDGLMVLTRRYLVERGYCCSNGCRHCPYQTDSEEKDLELIGPAR